MTILSGLNTSLTGLLGFSRSLDVISDNLANLNSAGFKANDLLLRDLGAGNPYAGFSRLQLDRGQGVEVVGTARRFTQGEIRQTGSDTNFAISGDGFFIVASEEGTRYTRAGQFQFDDRGRLVSSVGGGALQALSGPGDVKDLSINRSRTFPPTATSNVSIAGNLSRGGESHTINDLSMIDADGASIPLTLNFTNNSETLAGSWAVTGTDAQGNELLSGEIRFDGVGTPVDGFSTLTLSLTADSGTETDVLIDFGTPGSTDGTTSFSSGTNSTATVRTVDGFAAGTLTSFTVGRDGVFTLQYSNAQSEIGPSIAIARFTDPQQLQFLGQGDFEAPKGVRPTISAPQIAGAGDLVSGSLELANVELTNEFAQILILQRGFQSSSQVLNVSGELIETLYNSVSGRG